MNVILIVDQEGYIWINYGWREAGYVHDVDNACLCDIYAGKCNELWVPLYSYYDI